MRGHRPRTDLGFDRAETRRTTSSRAGGPLVAYAAIAALIVALAMLAAIRPERGGSGAASADTVLLTLGETDRPADWDAFFARHPLPDDAIRQRIRAANEGAPTDVVCVPLEAGAAETGCR